MKFAIIKNVLRFVVHEIVIHESVLHEIVIHGFVLHEIVIHRIVIHEIVIHEIVIHEIVIHRIVIHEIVSNKIYLDEVFIISLSLVYFYLRQIEQKKGYNFAFMKNSLDVGDSFLEKISYYLFVSTLDQFPESSRDFPKLM